MCNFLSFCILQGACCKFIAKSNDFLKIGQHFLKLSMTKVVFFWLAV